MKVLSDGWDLFENSAQNEQKIFYPVTFGEFPRWLLQILTREPVNTQERRKLKSGLPTTLVPGSSTNFTKFEAEEDDHQ